MGEEVGDFYLLCRVNGVTNGRTRNSSASGRKHSPPGCSFSVFSHSPPLPLRAVSPRFPSPPARTGTWAIPVGIIPARFFPLVNLTDLFPIIFPRSVVTSRLSSRCSHQLRFFSSRARVILFIRDRGGNLCKCTRFVSRGARRVRSLRLCKTLLGTFRVLRAINLILFRPTLLHSPAA